MDGVKLLLSHGADVHEVNRRGETPLHLARDAATVRALLEGDADPNSLNRRGESLLHTCEQTEIFDILLLFADLNFRTPATQRTALISTLAEGYSDSIKRVNKALRLIESGADVRLTDKYGNSALHYAVGMDSVGTPLVERLCSAGADVKLKNHHGKTPLHMLARTSWPRFDGPTHSGSLDDTMLHVLLEAGADINARDNQGATLLLLYIENGKDYFEDSRLEWIERFVQAGADINTCDSRGRSLLHDEVSSVDWKASLLDFITNKGVDPNRPDSNGNTLFHEAAPKVARMGHRNRGPELAQKLTEMGVDPGKPNHAGRTPLHIIASINPTSFDGSDSQTWVKRPRDSVEECGVDFFLRLYSNVVDVDAADKHGVRPLHLASTFSEYITRRLLEEGASPSKPIEEGLTALHLAARSRQANIIGIVLDQLASTSKPEEVSAVVNARDNMNKTALYYAASSGRVESFQLLLDSGANLDDDVYAGSCWNGCADFEEELARWRHRSNHHDVIPQLREDLGVAVNAQGAATSDTTRPFQNDTGHSGRLPFPIERLDDILDIIASSASKEQIPLVDQAISSASEKGHEYTVECLLRARERLHGHRLMEQDLDEKTKACLYRRRKNTASDANRNGDSLLQLMKLRSYTKVIGRFTRTNCVHVADRHPQLPLVSQLALGGFAALLSKAASEDVLSHMVMNKQQDQKARPRTPPQSLLICACAAEIPNMDVIRVLVEEKKVNVNEQYLKRGYSGLCKCPTALHVLAEGGYWWQSAQAIPYLVQHGADLEAVEEENGLTPLGYALRNIDSPLFSKRAVKMLLTLGARADKTDRYGVSYLSWSIRCPEMFQQLLESGAVPTRSTLEAAIRQQNVEVLQMLLSNGVDPNERKIGEERPEIWHTQTGISEARSDPHTPDEMYLIHWMATVLERREHERKGVDNRMLKMLLEHGADPFAAYSRTTVLHRIMENRGINTTSGCQNRHLDLLLDQPGLDFDTCDDDGMTLLMLATSTDNFDDKASIGVIQKLLERGADIYARDHKGRSIMHHAARYPQRCEFVLGKAPELINPRDNEGKTPLHYALGSIRNWGATKCVSSPILLDSACYLIQKGADVARPDNDGKTPLHLVMSHSEWLFHKDNTVGGSGADYFHTLVTRGVNVNACSKVGETPIFDYIRHGSILAEIDESDQSRNNEPEYIVLIHGQREMEAAVPKEGTLWKLFEQHGIDFHAVNESGQGLLHLVAQEKNRFEYPDRRVARFKLLTEKGLDPTLEDKDHRTPLDLANALGHEDILDLFKRSEREGRGP